MSSGLSDQRRLPLEGAINFRDLGGYATADGHRVRYGRLYRSDSLAELTAADHAVLARLGLRSVFDLRHDSERRRKPNRLWPDPGLQVHDVGFLPYKADAMFADVRAGRASAEAVDAAVREMYRRLPLDHCDCYARLLAALAEPHTMPALIHCTSGKDRTGFAAAVVLLALGVDRETILRDYLLTNQYQRDLSFVIGADADPAVAETLTRAHAEHLSEALDVMDATWGSCDAYLRDGLGLTAVARDSLRKRLVESA